MSHFLLDRGKVYACHDELASEGVTERVDFSDIGEAASFGDAHEIISEFAFEGSSIFARKDVPAFALFFEALKEVADCGVHGDFALTGFGLPDIFELNFDFTAVEVDIVPGEVEDFTFSHAGVEECSEDVPELARAFSKKFPGLLLR